MLESCKNLDLALDPARAAFYNQTRGHCRCETGLDG